MLFLSFKLKKNIDSARVFVHVTLVVLLPSMPICWYLGRTEEFDAERGCDVCVAHLWAVFTSLLHLTA